MKEVIWVGIGGFLGSSGRYLVGLIVQRYDVGEFPLATLIVNLVGSFLIGLILGYLIKSPNQLLQLLLITGFCGGFTTFSTFSREGLELIRHSHYFQYALYTGISIIGGLLLCLLGYLLMQKPTG